MPYRLFFLFFIMKIICKALKSRPKPGFQLVFLVVTGLKTGMAVGKTTIPLFDQMRTTFVAISPFWPSETSKMTLSPSFRERNPSA